MQPSIYHSPFLSSARSNEFILSPSGTSDVKDRDRSRTVSAARCESLRKPTRSGARASARLMTPYRRCDMTRNSLRLSYQASFILPEASELNLEELPNDMLVEIPFAADLVRV